MTVEKKVTLHSMSWSDGQEAALDEIMDWVRFGGSSVFRMFGYAGTGKTWLASYIGNEVPGTFYATFTGKAAHVLR
jgi:exodeoxyribonuclease V